MKKIILFLIMLVTLTFIQGICADYRTAVGREAVFAGQKAEDFTLKDLKDTQVSLNSFFGKKALLLDFSATWCPHCIAIIPSLAEIYKNYNSKGLEVIGIYIRESKDTMHEFTKRHGITYTTLLDINGSVARAYGVVGIPTVIIIDKNGIIRYNGHQIQKDIIEEVVR